MYQPGCIKLILTFTATRDPRLRELLIPHLFCGKGHFLRWAELISISWRQCGFVLPLIEQLSLQQSRDAADNVIVFILCLMWTKEICINYERKYRNTLRFLFENAVKPPNHVDLWMFQPKIPDILAAIQKQTVPKMYRDAAKFFFSSFFPTY